MSTIDLTSAPPRFRRLILPDPALTSCFGHHYNYTRALVEAARRRGIEVVVLCHANADPIIVEGLPALPIFRIGTYSELNMDDNVPNSEFDEYDVQGFQLVHLNMYFLNELKTLNQVIGPEDMVFFHTIMEHQILAITQWVAGLPLEQRPMTNLLLRFWHQDRPHVTPMLQLCASVLNNPKMRSRFSTDTMELSSLYTNIVRGPVDVVPIPHSPASHGEGEDRRRFLPEDLDPDTVVVGFLGDCRGNKGFMFLRSIIANIFAAPPGKVHFLLQISNSSFPPNVLAEIQGLVAMAGLGITIVMETLSAEDYYAILDECDIVLVSYYPKHYMYGSSGIFTESATAGKVTVVPAGTNMEHEAMRFRTGYTSFEHFTVEGIADALRRAIANYPVLAERSKAATEALNRYHNADNLLAYLLGEEIEY